MRKFDAVIFSTVVEGNGTLPQVVAGPHRIATEIRNLNLSCQVIHHFHKFTNDELIEVLDNLVDENTLLIGFSTVFWSHMSMDSVKIIRSKVELISSYILDKNYKCKIIGGGGSVHLLQRFNLSKLDALFEGYPESILIEYTNSIKENTVAPTPDYYTQSGFLKIGVYKQTDDTALFNFRNSKIEYKTEDFISPHDVVTIEVARGCIFKCKFCAFPLNGKNNFDYIKNVECIREELIENYEKFQIQNYILSDDTFNDSMYKIELLHKMIISLPFKIRFSCYLRLDLLNAHREQIDMLKEMGMKGTYFGVETFHKKAASLIGKGLDPDKAKNLLHDLKHVHWKNDVKIAVGLITGIPHETYDSYQETKKWILSEDNLVELIRVVPLFIPNPKLNKPDPNVSIFEKEHTKYGFYWVGNTDNWKNLTGPVKSYEEAKEIADDLKFAAYSVSRELQGGFNMFQAWRSAPIIDESLRSLDDLISMDRFQFTTWYHKIYRNMDSINKYYTHYKNNFLKRHG